MQAKRTLLFAGGIGVTPILCMAERLANIGADFDMYYCARSRERTAFVDRISRSSWVQRAHLHFDDGPAELRLDLPPLLARPDDGRHLYVCGPGGFIEYVTSTAKQSGWASGNVHLEYFGAQPQDMRADDAFEVKIASSGKCFTVPADSTVVRVLEENGINIPLMGCLSRARRPSCRTLH